VIKSGLANFHRQRLAKGLRSSFMVKARSKATAAPTSRTKTGAYDVSEQLRTPEEVAAYLDAWLAEAPEDAAGIARALGDIARAKGMTQVARDTGLSRESLYKALSESGNPTFATVLKVAKALGVRFHAQVA
jgi:probable addiction module antidote protein